MFSDCDSYNPALLDVFISSNPSVCSSVLFPLLENCNHVTVSVSINFASNSKRDVPYHCVAYDCSHVDWGGLCDH